MTELKPCPSCGAKMKPISASPENGQEGGSMTDYIDRLAIMKEFADFVRESNNSDFARTPTWNDAVLLVGSMPSAEAEPVKHGRWKHEIRNTIDSLHPYQQFRCSVCGMTYITNTPYCPNCGAKMDAEEGESHDQN